MKQLKLLILLISLIMLTACGATVIQVVNSKGIQEPTNEFILQSVSTKMKIICHGTKRVIMSEESIYPQYFDLDKPQTIYSSETKELYIELYVENPQRIKYTLVKTLTAGNDDITLSKEIFSGKDIQKVFQLHGTLKYRDQPIKLEFEIYVEGYDFPIFKKSCSYIVNPSI